MTTETGLASGTFRVDSRAPTRVDLAGGTLDIWPLYLFLKDPLTINLAIDLFAEAHLETTPGHGRVKLQAQDQKAEVELTWDTLESTRVPPSLELHAKLLRHYRALRVKAGHADSARDLSLSTLARSPAGAGLGGSSALSVALVGALTSWEISEGGTSTGAGHSVDPLTHGERWIDVVRDVETTVIQVPAGLQDYYGAMFGGLQQLGWRAGRHERSWMEQKTFEKLEQRLLLFYSGQSRNSGINNWALFKAFIDKQGEVRNQFEGIAAATQELAQALKAEDWRGVEKAIAAEWTIRRGIAAGISTAEIDHAFAVAAEDGVRAGKVCGAGGGGCFFLLLPEENPELKARVQKRIVDLGIRALPFRAVPRGLSVQVSRA